MTRKVWVKCARCNGEGKIVSRYDKIGRMSGSGYYEVDSPVYATCPVCDGDGKHETEVLEEEES